MSALDDKVGPLAPPWAFELMGLVRDTAAAVAVNAEWLASLEERVQTLESQDGDETDEGYSRLPVEHVEQMIRDVAAITGSMGSLVERVARLEREVLGTDALDDEWSRFDAQEGGEAA